MKKVIGLLIVLTLFMTMLTACGNESESTAESAETVETNETAETVETPEEEETPTQVVAGINADYSTFDPAYSYEKSARMIMHASYDTLVEFDLEGNVVPKVAQEWTVSEDQLTYTFTLRDDVVATTGKTIDATDVKFVFDRLSALQGNPSFLAEPIESVEATGDFEVTITLKQVTPSILAVLTESAFSLYDSVAAQENGATLDSTTDTAQAFFDTASIGSGPYSITSYTQDTQLVLQKNDAYWGEPGEIDTIVMQQVSDPSMQLMMLEKGEIDFAFDLTNVQLESITSEDVEVREFSTLDIFTLQYNMDEEIGGPLANATVREAIAYALDYEGIRAIAGNGATTPYNVIPKGMAGYLGESEITRDVEKAKELLIEAGYADGFTFDCGAIPDMAIDGVAFMDMAVKIQADLAEVGITMNIIPDEVSVYLEKLRSAEYQVAVGMWGPDYNDPASQLSFMPGENVGLRSNWTADMAPELAELTEKAKQETDLEVRNDYIKQIQEVYAQIPGPVNVYLQPGYSLAVSSRIDNLDYTASTMVNFATLTVK